MARHGHVRLLLLTLVATTGVAAALAPTYRAPALDVFDREDASPQELLLAFAELRGEDVRRLPVPGRDVPASPDWSTALRGLYASAGLVATPEELAALAAQDAALDPRLQRVVVPLVDALAQATSLSLAALADEDDARALRTSAALVMLDTMDWLRPTLVAGDVAGFDPECYDWTTVTPRTGFSFLDSCDLPRFPDPPLEDEDWPTEVTSDPLGLVSLGTLGDDIHATDRWLLLDRAGNDQWRNNAGGGYVFSGIDTNTPAVKPVLRPVAVSWDGGGNDRYAPPQTNGPAIGSAERAVGILEDVSGDDVYDPHRAFTIASANQQAIAVLRDFGGNDSYSWGEAGWADTRSRAIMIEAEGNDAYAIGMSLSCAFAESDSYFRDSSGQDSYSALCYGAQGSSRAYFRDWAGATDSYFGGSSEVGNNGRWFDTNPSGDAFWGEGWDS